MNDCWRALSLRLHHPLSRFSPRGVQGPPSPRLLPPFKQPWDWWWIRLIRINLVIGPTGSPLHVRGPECCQRRLAPSTWRKREAANPPKKLPDVPKQRRKMSLFGFSLDEEKNVHWMNFFNFIGIKLTCWTVFRCYGKYSHALCISLCVLFDGKIEQFW